MKKTIITTIVMTLLLATIASAYGNSGVITPLEKTDKTGEKYLSVNLANNKEANINLKIGNIKEIHLSNNQRPGNAVLSIYTKCNCGKMKMHLNGNSDRVERTKVTLTAKKGTKMEVAMTNHYGKSKIMTAKENKVAGSENSLYTVEINGVMTNMEVI